MRDTFVKSLLEIASKDKNVILITGDLGFGVLNEFWKQLPNQIINVGIAEQNMIGFASGLAKSGKIVYVYSIANFPSLRPLEQIRNDTAYHNLNVKIVSIGSGLSYGALGMSHHGTEDLGILNSVPNLNIICPPNDSFTHFLTYKSYQTSGPFYIRLDRSSSKINVLDNISLSLKPLKLFNLSTKFAIFTFGSLSLNVINAVLNLRKCNYIFEVFIITIIKPIDVMEVRKIISEYEFIIVFEEHNTLTGLGSIIKNCIESINDRHFFSFGIYDSFVSIVGSQEYLLDCLGLSVIKIELALKDIYEKYS